MCVLFFAVWAGGVVCYFIFLGEGHVSFFAAWAVAFLLFAVWAG